MSDFVLVSQGIECDRNVNPYPIIKYAIDANKEYNKYFERCMENYEIPVDNEMFVYKEERDKTEEVDLFMCEQLIEWTREKTIYECINTINSMIPTNTYNGGNEENKFSKIMDFINNKSNEEGLYDFKEILELENEIRSDAIDKFVDVLKTEPFSEYVMNIVYHWQNKLKENKNE